MRTLGDRLDFVICSIHQVGDLEFWNGDFQRRRSQEEINCAYYEELLSVVECFRDYSVLGHLDLIRRYDPFGDYPFACVRDLVAEILRRVIDDGKGIEVNTSGMRYGLGDFQPSRQVLELYRDLGGGRSSPWARTHTGPSTWAPTCASPTASSGGWASRASGPSSGGRRPHDGSPDG